MVAMMMVVVIFGGGVSVYVYCIVLYSKSHCLLPACFNWKIAKVIVFYALGACIQS